MSSHRILSGLTCCGILVWAACGDSTGPAADRNDPGTGTQTMMVEADIDGEDVPGGFVTTFEVRLRDPLDNPISGAIVTIENSALGTVNLLETDAGSGDYEATRNTFAPGDYSLDVVSGDDNVRDVVIGGMSVHEIMSPASNDTVTANTPLIIEWSRPAQAAGVDVETRDFLVEGIADLGELTIPAEFVTPRADERVRVERFNKVDIAGGLFGSRIKLGIRNSVEPLVVQ